MSNENCGECYFYDHIDQRQRTIYCRLWQQRRSQYDPCPEWREYNNDPVQVKEAEAQRIRDEHERRRQNTTAQERHEESMAVQRKSISIGKIALIIAIVGLTITLIFMIV